MTRAFFFVGRCARDDTHPNDRMTAHARETVRVIIIFFRRVVFVGGSVYGFGDTVFGFVAVLAGRFGSGRSSRRTT